jgi:hypothetical protein
MTAMTGRDTDSSAADPLAHLRAERDQLLAQRASLELELAQARHDIAIWRTTALEGWDTAAGTGGGGAFAGDEAAAMRATLSWRITRPLRMVRGQMGPSALRG